MAKFSDQEKVDILLKKNFGKVSTDTSLAYYSEPAFDARPKIFQSQIFEQEIPVTNPNDFGLVSNGSKGSSTSYNYIVYYKKWQLLQVTPGNNQSFKGPSDGLISNILQNSLPFNYDPAGGYAVVLQASNNDIIADGTGEWVIDTDAGILTFHEYNDVSSYVDSSSKLPYLSFYRYSGSIGITSGIFSNNSAEDGINYSITNKTVLLGKTVKDYTPSSGKTNLEVNGDIYATSLITTSDRKLKKNIKKIENPIEKIKKLNGVSFNWKNNNLQSSGIIAQDLEKIMPEAVINGKNIKSVNYSSIIGLLVETVKELNIKYDDLYNKYNDLNNKYNNLNNNDLNNNNNNN